MVQSNKILTVSYGTFSCTLEGFDDSFHTMKAIAEYFRDLAADDRYFGAEPPVPDAEMLARIAEREIARRVEAHMDDQGILLRAAPALGAAAAAPSAADPETTAAPEPDAPEQLASEQPVPEQLAPEQLAPEQPAPEQPAYEPSAADAQARAPQPDIVAETAADHKGEETPGAEAAAVVQDETDAETAQPDAAGADDTAPEGDAEGDDARSEKDRSDADAIADPVIDAAPEEAVPEQIIPEQIAAQADAPEDGAGDPAAPDIAGPEPTHDVPDQSTSIAAKLARIRAVVSGEPPAQDTYSEDEHADATDRSGEVLSDPVSLDETHSDLSGQDETEDAAAPSDAGALDVLSRVAATIVGQAGEDRVQSDEDAAAEEPETSDGDDDKAAADEAPEAEDRPVDDAAHVDQETVAEAVADSGDADGIEDVAEEAAAPAAGPRVHRVRVQKRNARTEQPAPLVLDSDTRVEEESETSLSPEDEDELMRELAELEAEMADHADLDDGDEDTDLAESAEAPEETDDEPEVELAAADDADDNAAHTAEDDDGNDMAERADAEAMPELAGEKDDAPLAAESDAGADAKSDADDAIAERVRAAAMGSEMSDAPDMADETAALDDDSQNVTAADAPAPDDEPKSAISRSIRALTRRVRLSENAAGGANRDVSRLMETADKQMEEPEGRNRRNAIAHLRAAVAATQDERASGGVASPEKAREAQFREDLDAVRPRPDDSATPKVAPLKLVAEQRVDVEDPADEQADMPAEQADQLAAAPAASVGPRRISPRRPNLAARRSAEPEGDGFLAYAEDIGAHELPDLLEAAAAYLSFVEKRDQFSRPQLMNKVREVETREYSREDRLRFFGQLLRDGKIEKTERGRFTASDQIGFRPDERAAS